jgi:hypothetical protein
VRSVLEDDMSNPVERARAAVHELLAAYQDARTTNEREEVASAIALLTPNGGRPLAELAAEALRGAKEPG